MPASVEINDLSFSYSEDKLILENLNLYVSAGEKLGIIGPMGAGKSTLLLHLNGILAGTGSVKIGDSIVTKNNLPEIRRRIGLVFQNPDDQLFNPTVEEDIAFGPINFGYSADEVSERVKFAIEQMDLIGFEEDSSHHLSMGERKRVALATVLALKPEIIAFDEPFASLDVQMIKNLVSIISKLDSTLIIVSHAIFPLAACCQRIAIMNNGKIVAIGPTREILRDSDLLMKNGIDLDFYRNVSKVLFD
jgi:cobalt/nickel transport system ATP-binding protein